MSMDTAESLKDITLNAGQEQALKLGIQCAKQHNPERGPAVGIIKGPAGSGKTRVLQKIADEVGEVVVLAPTGRAALRVMEATGLDASTMHRFLYAPQWDESIGEWRYSLRDFRTARKIQKGQSVHPSLGRCCPTSVGSSACGTRSTARAA